MSDSAEASKEISPFAVLEFPMGKVAFVGGVRTARGGINEFCVELPNRHPMYGHWRPKFAANEHDFDIEIVTFGYLSKGNVGNPYPTARETFSQDEKKAAEDLVVKLFKSDRKNKIPAFTLRGARFMGNIIFLDDWIRLSSK